MFLAKLLLGALTLSLAADGDMNNVGLPEPQPMVSIYEGATGTLSATPSKITFTTATYDTQPGTIVNGQFKCGNGGIFSVSASLAINATIALNNTLTLEIHVNGAAKRTVSVALPALLTKASTSVSNIVFCPANGLIEIRAGSNALSPTITALASENTFTILKLFIDK